MKKMARVFSLVLTFSALVGCAFSKDDAKRKEQITNIEVRHDLTESAKFDPKDMHMKIRPKPEFGKYEVLFYWEPTEHLNFEFQETEPRITFKSQEGTKGSITFDIDTGEHKTILVKALNRLGGEEGVNSFEVVAPEDRIFSGEQRLGSDQEWKLGRLRLSKGSTILTMGHSLRIVADAIVAESSSQIETFPEGYGDKGVESNGGVLNENPNILISAKSASGELEIQMNGYNGAMGRDGDYVAASSSLNGKPGSPAKAEFYDDDLQSMGPPFNRDRTKPPPYCISHPGPGGNGANGQDGGPGQDGGNGGGTGNLKVDITDSSDFLIYLKIHPGAAGFPGLGGKGQPGGLGGAAGSNPNYKSRFYGTFSFTPCPNASAGRPGKPGIDGKNGKPGLVGAVGKIELGSTKYHLLPGSLSVQ